MPTSDRLKSICSHLKPIDTYRQISSVLSWDQETMMPPGAIQARAHQLETLAGLIHDAWNNPRLADAMADLIDITNGKPVVELSEIETAFMRECYPQWKRNTQLSKSLVQALSNATSTAQHAWQHAREADDFSLFSGHLTHLIALSKEKINELGGAHHPYDALIEEFEPGMSVKQLDAIFDPLKEKTIEFLQNHPKKNKPTIHGPFDEQAQLAYSTALMGTLGYSTQNGRLDCSTHPFTMDIHPSDVRITTRIDPHYLFESISSTIHEVGHALYEQGLDPEWAGTPYGAPRSMGVHESQSRFWELFIGQSLPFWKGQLANLHRHFPNTASFSAQDFFHACTAIQPHWCRVKSDAITTNLHIILRYECEKALFDGSLTVNDLPKVWNQKMADYLGLHIESHSKGCLQDVHWSAGLFGYFPSYTLGTLIAAELFQVVCNELGNVPSLIASGNFDPIRQWLRVHVHQHGSKKTTQELLTDLGIAMNPQVLFDHYQCSE